MQFAAKIFQQVDLPVYFCLLFWLQIKYELKNRALPLEFSYISTIYPMR